MKSSDCKVNNEQYRSIFAPTVFLFQEKQAASSFYLSMPDYSPGLEQPRERNG